MITKNGIQAQTEETPLLPNESTPKETPKTKSYLGEKNELINCNNRLERYIAGQRAKDQKVDILENQIEELRDNLAAEKDRIRLSVKNTLDKLRKEKNSLHTKFLHSKSSHEKLETRFRKANTELSSKSAALSNSEQRLSELIRKREEDNAILSRLNEMVKRSRAEREQFGKEAKFLKGDNDALRKERDALAKSLNALKSQREKRQSDEQFKQKTYQEMVQSYENEIRELKAKTSDIEDSLRIEFSEQLDETLKSRQKNFSKEKAKALAELTRLFEEKVCAARKESEDAAAALEELKAEAADFEARLAKSCVERDLAEKSLEASAKKAALLEQKVTALKLKPLRREQHNAHVLKLMKEAYRKKEAEIEAEREEKLSLQLEIRSYREILDTEFHRIDSRRRSRRSSLGRLAAPPRKAAEPPKASPRLASLRKRTRRSSGRPEGVAREEKPPRKKAPPAEEQPASLVLECYGSAARIEIKNKSAESVSVEHWRLRKPGQDGAANEVEFPPQLRHNESFFVYPSQALLDGDASAGVKRVWNAAAFESAAENVQIINESGVEMYQIEFSEKEDAE